MQNTVWKRRHRIASKGVQVLKCKLLLPQEANNGTFSNTEECCSSNESRENQFNIKQDYLIKQHSAWKCDAVGNE